MRTPTRWHRALLALLLGLTSAVAGADAPLTCPNASVFGGNLVSSVCWSCLFPIRIGPAGGTGLNMPDAIASPVCVCPGRVFGMPTPGVTLGMWIPSRLIEMVRVPYCSPSLGTTFATSTMQNMSGRNWGKLESSSGSGSDASSYYNFHYFAFPVGVILDAFTDQVCVSQSGGYDMDLLWLSELSPLWANDELAFFTNPESALLDSPAAIAACIADAGASSLYKPITALWWCVGSWGLLSPYSGHSSTSGSPPREASLLGVRGIATMHRLGLSKLTYGNSAVCKAHPWPTLPKQQYRQSVMHPVAEVTSNHWLGASTFRWGEWRNVPAPAVDSQYVILNWTYTECCMNY